MSGDHPPPYAPPPPAQGFAVGAPYQAAPSSYYQGPQQFGTPLGYHTAFYDPPQGWDAPKAYGGPPKHTVYVVEQNEGAGRGGAGAGGCGALRSLLSACSTLLCCCCLCDLLTRHL